MGDAGNTAPPQKICTTCGTDVSTIKRVKDRQGHYFCEPCWTYVLARRNSVTPENLSAPQAVDAAGPTAVTATSGTDAVSKFTKLRPWLLTTIVLGFVLPPVGVLFQIFVSIRMTSILQSQPRWLWIAGGCLPYIGPITLLRLNAQAVRRFEAVAVKSVPLTQEEAERYANLVRLRHLGWAMAFIPVIAIYWFGSNGPVLLLVLGGVISFVGFGFLTVAWTKLQPFRQRVRQAKGVRTMTIYTTDPVADYEQRLIDR